MKHISLLLLIACVFMSLDGVTIEFSILTNYDSEGRIWVEGYPANGYPIILSEGQNQVLFNYPGSLPPDLYVDVYLVATPIEYPNHPGYDCHFTGFVNLFENSYPPPNYHSSPFLAYFTLHPSSEFEVPVYSNIEDREVIVRLADSENPSTDYTVSQTIKKGWNRISFAGTTGSFSDLSFAYAEISVEYEYSQGSHYYVESYDTVNYGFAFNHETEKYECEPVRFVFENKPFVYKYEWVSFPKLSRSGNDPVYACSLFESNIYIGFDYFRMQIGQDYELVYEHSYWSNLEHQIQSSGGVIINMEDQTERVFVPSAGATVLSPGTQIPLEAGENYIGYWLPESQTLREAFGEHWDKVKWVKYRNWFYYDTSGIRDGWVPEYGTGNIPLHYGEGYIVNLREPISDFSWEIPSGGELPPIKERSEPDHFQYTEKSDYDMVILIDIPQDVQEIGVYQNDVCVGAVVAEDDTELLMVYAQSNDPLEFELITGRSRDKITRYAVYNNSTAAFEQGVVRGGSKGGSIVSLSKNDYPENPSSSQITLYRNYPNPFNPDTTIAFHLSSDDIVTLTIFNTKGQKVKDIFAGFLSGGTHRLLWNGTDEQGRAVSSGVYFYRLETSLETKSSKIILLK
jgi:hypothetical protein